MISCDCFLQLVKVIAEVHAVWFVYNKINKGKEKRKLKNEKIIPPFNDMHFFKVSQPFWLLTMW